MLKNYDAKGVAELMGQIFVQGIQPGHDAPIYLTGDDRAEIPALEWAVINGRSLMGGH
jgi:hypothetical protein